jgi:hypothetical protein
MICTGSTKYSIYPLAINLIVELGAGDFLRVSQKLVVSLPIIFHNDRRRKCRSLQPSQSS